MSETELRRAYALHQDGNIPDAVAAYREVLRQTPRNFDALYLCGVAELQLGNAVNAERLLALANAVNPRSPGAQHWHGTALASLGRAADAIAAFDRALALKPDLPESWTARGHALMQLRRPQDAAAAYDRALALKPGTPEKLYNRANAFSILKRYPQAIADCEALLAKEPDYPYARGILMHSKLDSCDWRGLDEQKSKIAAALATGARVISPFNLKALSDSPEQHLQCARAWVANECPPQPPLWSGDSYGHSRIRLAYVSSDFNASAMANLMAGVFEGHDRARFETIAISFGPNEPTPMRQRLQAAFERFIDVRDRTEADIAGLMRQMEIDIAVDLLGFTGECRSGIFARRPAPVQVNFLGFPGTMGAPYIDYIVGDRTVVPDDARPFFAESVAYLPDCYQPNDATRAIAETPPRAKLGLPEDAFVFCSFNNSFKILPEIFDAWMRLLARIPASVLWLLQDNPHAAANLKREAEARGIAPERLVFAPRIPPADHLARYRAADLFLDTFPCNAHTTASDALWAGLPLVTCAGQSFAARVAASILAACGLSELVTTSFAQYEALALRLATDRAALTAIRAKLADNRGNCPLFDTARITRHLETAFSAMTERHRSSLPRATFAVEPGGASVTVVP